MSVSHGASPMDLDKVKSKCESLLRLFRVKEVKLFNSNEERERVETMADLYSIFVATESLEKAYIRDAVSKEEYECSMLRFPCNPLATSLRVQN